MDATPWVTPNVARSPHTPLNNNDDDDEKRGISIVIVIVMIIGIATVQSLRHCFLFEILFEINTQQMNGMNTWQYLMLLFDGDDDVFLVNNAYITICTICALILYFNIYFPCDIWG